MTAGFSSEPYPLCSYFCLSFASLQGARGPDGPAGEPGSRGVKVSAKAALSSAVKCSGHFKVTSSSRNRDVHCSMRINQQGWVCLAARVKSIQHWDQGPCPHSQLVGVFLGAQSQVFGLSKAAGNWKGNLRHKKARADGLREKSITHSLCPC